MVMVTLNPTSWSYLGWRRADRPDDNLPLKALAGVVLLSGFLIFLRGLILAGLSSRPWVLIDYGWLDPTPANPMTCWSW